MCMYLHYPFIWTSKRVDVSTGLRIPAKGNTRRVLLLGEQCLSEAKEVPRAKPKAINHTHTQHSH